jgi:hypothetical protein
MSKFLNLDNLKTFLSECRRIFVAKSPGMGLSESSFTEEEKGKLSTVEMSAQANKIEKINLAGKELFPVNKVVNIDAYTKKEINDLIKKIPNFKIEVVTALPTSNIDDATIYLVRGTGSGENMYDEYIHVNNNWERLGGQSQSLDLTNYATKAELPKKVSDLKQDVQYMDFINNIDVCPMYISPTTGTLDISENLVVSSTFSDNVARRSRCTTYAVNGSTDTSTPNTITINLPGTLDVNSIIPVFPKEPSEQNDRFNAHNLEGTALFTIFIKTYGNSKLSFGNNALGVVFNRESKYSSLEALNNDIIKTNGYIIIKINYIAGLYFIEDIKQYYVNFNVSASRGATIMINNIAANGTTVRVPYAEPVRVSAANEPGYTIVSLHAAPANSPVQPPSE